MGFHSCPLCVQDRPMASRRSTCFFAKRRIAWAFKTRRVLNLSWAMSNTSCSRKFLQSDNLYGCFTILPLLIFPPTKAADSCIATCSFNVSTCCVHLLTKDFETPCSSPALMQPCSRANPSGRQRPEENTEPQRRLSRR